jgi:hypothetical protein
MTRSIQRLTDPGKISGGGAVGNRGDWQAMRLSYIQSGRVEFTL